MNLTDEGVANLFAFMLAAMTDGDGPYPIALIIGNINTGKSWITEAVKGLIDAEHELTMRDRVVVPENPKELVDLAERHRLVCLDDLTYYKDQDFFRMKDAITRLTDFQPVLVNGTKNTLLRDKEFSRVFVIQTNDKLAEHKTKQELRAIAERYRPSILKGLENALELWKQDSQKKPISFHRCQKAVARAETGAVVNGFDLDELLMHIHLPIAKKRERDLEGLVIFSTLTRILQKKEEPIRASMGEMRQKVIGYANKKSLIPNSSQGFRQRILATKNDLFEHSRIEITFLEKINKVDFFLWKIAKEIDKKLLADMSMHSFRAASVEEARQLLGDWLENSTLVSGYSIEEVRAEIEKHLAEFEPEEEGT